MFSIEEAYDSFMEKIYGLANAIKAVVDKTISRDYNNGPKETTVHKRTVIVSRKTGKYFKEFKGKSQKRIFTDDALYAMKFQTPDEANAFCNEHGLDGKYYKIVEADVVFVKY